MTLPYKLNNKSTNFPHSQLHNYMYCTYIHVHMYKTRYIEKKYPHNCFAHIENKHKILCIFFHFPLSALFIEFSVYPYNCFAMTMYQSLLIALVPLPFYVLENWDLKK